MVTAGGVEADVKESANATIKGGVESAVKESAVKESAKTTKGVASGSSFKVSTKSTRGNAGLKLPPKIRRVYVIFRWARRLIWGPGPRKTTSSKKIPEAESAPKRRGTDKPIGRNRGNHNKRSTKDRVKLVAASWTLAKVMSLVSKYYGWTMEKVASLFIKARAAMKAFVTLIKLLWKWKKACNLDFVHLGRNIMLAAFAIYVAWKAFTRRQFSVTPPSLVDILQSDNNPHVLQRSRFGADAVDIVTSWTKNLCINISQGRMENLEDEVSSESESGEQIANDLSSWSVLDIGTGNGLLLQVLAKKGFSDMTGTDYSEGAINLARNLAERDGFNNIRFLVDDVLETKLERQFRLVMDKGTLDAIGLHPDGPMKRIMYWDSVSRLVAPGGILVITSCNHTKDELVLEVDSLKQRSITSSPDADTSNGHEAFNGSSPFRYISHIRSFPTFMFGGSEGSRVATVAFFRS